MNIYYETNFLSTSSPSRGTVATIGFFDGVHKGHRYLLDRLRILADKHSYSSMVVTFANHPREIFQPHHPIALLSTNTEKRYLIENLGIDKCLMLTFDNDISSLTSEEFLKILAYKYNVKLLLVGHNHSFGSDTHSTINDYVQTGKKLGIEIIQEKVLLEDNVDISSSKIRKAILSGDIITANNYLGYTFSLTGKVVSGKKIGRTIGYPTANIFINEKKIIPRFGVYAVRVHTPNGHYIGMLNIGKRPTVNGKNTSIEVHILDFSDNLYGKEINISLHKYLREEIKFPSKEELIKQITIDKNEVINYFLNQSSL